MHDLTSDIASKVVVNAFTEVFKSCYKALQNASGWLIDESKQHDFFGVASRNYLTRIQDRYDKVRIFGMNEPVKLRDIYTRVNVLERPTSQRRETPEELARNFDASDRRLDIVRGVRTAIQLVETFPKVILLGKPGAGKTTFLKYVTLQAALGAFQEKRIPIFVSLKDLSDSGMLLVDFMVNEFDICRFEDARPFILKLLESGRCLVLLDGLDEVSSTHEDQIITSIRDIADKYSENQFILTCRIAAYSYCFESFTEAEMADFDNAQIENFIYNWFGADRRTAQICWEQVKETPPIHELAHVPLLLTLLCLAFDETMGFPKNRAELYKEAVDALLKRWDASRRIKRDRIYRSLSVGQKENLFSRIAAKTFEDEKYFLPARVVAGMIGQFIEHLPDTSETTLLADSELMLRAIEAQHGILIERARDVYSFSHLTVQEYFTSAYIVGNASKGTLQALVQNHLTEDRWREVFLITTSMLKEADQLLTLMQSRITRISPRPILPLLKTASRMSIRTSRTSAKNAMRLALGRCHTLGDMFHRTLDYARSVRLEAEHLRGGSHKVRKGLMGAANDLHDNLTEEDCKRALNAADRLINSMTVAVNQEADLMIDADIDLRIMYDGATARRLASEVKIGQLRGFSARFIANAITYLNCNTLLVDCLNTGCYVNKSTRQQLFDRLLMAP